MPAKDPYRDALALAVLSHLPYCPAAVTTALLAQTLIGRDDKEACQQIISALKVLETRYQIYVKQSTLRATGNGTTFEREYWISGSINRQLTEALVRKVLRDEESATEADETLKSLAA